MKQTTRKTGSKTINQNPNIMIEKPPLLPILHLCGTKKNKLKALVFYSGYGLASYAFTQEGYDVIGGIEYEPIAAESYLANFPNSKVLVKSTRELTGTRIANYFNIRPGDVDVIEIGFPCPKISSTGPREQFHAMNDQFAVATKLALSLKPKVLLYENVPNITSEAMAVLLGIINSILKNYAPEYRCEARVLDSWLYGDYTSRPRWYLMAVHEDYGYPQWPEPLPESQRPVIRDFLPTAKWIHTRNYGHRYMIPGAPLSTITGHCDFKMLDMDTGEKRLLTVRERATAMGLPNDFILLGNQEQQGLGVGNGNAVMVTRKLAGCIREIIEGGGQSTPVSARRNTLIKNEEPVSKSLAKSNITWTDYTWNPWVGCHKCSAGCKFCYMYRLMIRWGKDPNTVSRTTRTTFRKPLKIKEPSKIFLCSWSDFFIEEADEWRSEVWQIIKETPWHTYQILTKRPERILQSLPDDWGDGYRNVWLGVSVENQEFTKRVTTLLAVPAAIRFISAEPLIGPVDFTGDSVLDNIDWIIIGGESGNNKGKYTYRECKSEWIQSLIDQGASSNTAVFVKQTGTHLAKELELKSRHGSNVPELPHWMQVQEFPTFLEPFGTEQRLLDDNRNQVEILKP